MPPVERPGTSRQPSCAWLLGFPLGIERVEFEIEIMLGRFAGVDRAALEFWNGRLHDLRSRHEGETRICRTKPRQMTGAVSRMRAMSPECRTR